ncbi:uncharacterized protein LOC144115176 isoform X2 [Amblyomma americanum]
MPRRLMTLHGSPACGGGLLSRGSSERSRVSQVSKVHSKMATCKRHKERLHESISMPQLGLAPRLALVLFLIGKKPRLQEAPSRPVGRGAQVSTQPVRLIHPQLERRASFARPGTRQPWLLVCVSSFGGHPSSLEPQECDPGATSHGHQLEKRNVLRVLSVGTLLQLEACICGAFEPRFTVCLPAVGRGLQLLTKTGSSHAGHGCYMASLQGPEGSRHHSCTLRPAAAMVFRDLGAMSLNFRP